VGTATPLPRAVDGETNVTVFVVPSALSTVVRAGGGDVVAVELVALLTAAAHITCYMRRIWAHRISFFVPRPRDTAHPGSGPAQARLRMCSGLLTFAQDKYHFRHAAPQHAELLQL